MRKRQKFDAEHLKIRNIEEGHLLDPLNSLFGTHNSGAYSAQGFLRAEMPSRWNDLRIETMKHIRDWRIQHAMPPPTHGINAWATIRKSGVHRLAVPVNWILSITFHRMSDLGGLGYRDTIHVSSIWMQNLNLKNDGITVTKMTYE